MSILEISINKNNNINIDNIQENIILFSDSIISKINKIKDSLDKDPIILELFKVNPANRKKFT
jgi:hypothetical protein